MRSEKELAQRLRNKDFSEETIKQAVIFLRERGFLDDRSFARSWITSKIKKPLGLRRIEQELKLKGVDKQIISEEISGVKEDYCEEEQVLELAKARLSKLKGIDRQDAKRRAYGYLLRRGFSPEIVIDTLNELCKRTS